MDRRRREFSPEAAALVRLQFQFKGASITYPRHNDNTAVQLNELDMDYRGFVPRDVAQEIMSGRITQSQVPEQYLSPHVRGAPPSL